MRVVASLPEWRQVFAEAVRDSAELCRLLDLPHSVATDAAFVAGFPVLVPQPYLKRIRRGDPNDPLLLQVLPRLAETIATKGFTDDPLDETHAASSPGLLWKYHGRALVVTTGACAVHCRFCFRRHFDYEGSESGKLAQPNDDRLLPTADRPTVLDDAFDRIAAEPSLREVILSGGDPLMLADRNLAKLAHRLADVPHLTRLRIHTRLPVMIPQRVTDDLLTWLRGTRLTPLVVVHVNHPAEIDAEVAAAFRRLIDAGVPLLSQGVLLRGVNDNVDTLVALYERLVDLGVMPYYLHQLDRVAGAAHFEVPVARGLELLAALRARLPGYAVPRYVRETTGGESKEVLGKSTSA